MCRPPIFFAFLGLACAGPHPVTLQEYYQLESVAEPVLSPDARQIAFTRSHIEEARNLRRSEIWLVPADGSAAAVRISDPGTNATGARWSPDGKLLAYTGKGTWFVRPGDPGHTPFQIPGVQGAPVFSPDNRWIAFTKKVTLSKETTPPLSEFDQLIDKRFQGKIYDWMNFRFDGRGYLPDPRNQSATPASELFVVPVEGGEARQLTTAGVEVLTPAWSPDSRVLAFTANSHQREEQSYERADLCTVTLKGETKRLTGDDGWHHRSPAWSPDGRLIAVLREEGLDRVLKAKRTQGAPLDLYVIPVAGGAPRNLTPNWDDLPGPPKWTSDGRILFHSGVKGTAHLFAVSGIGTASPRVEQVTQGDRVLSDASLVGKVLAYTAADPNHPAELYSALLSGAEHATVTTEKKLTAIHDPLLATWELGKTERIQYDSKDGTSIDGWVILPPYYDASKLYPLIVNIHGGPHGAFSSSFTFEEQLLAAAGYVVVYTNPRGSTGYGEKFQWGTWGAWGDRDLEDVMSGVDYAIKHYRADPKRLGVMGYSYGGFLTNWAIGHTDRFAAAVVGAGPSDWISNYGTGDIPRTKESEFLGKPWEPKANAVMIRQSPITYAANIHTPVLFVHGEADARVPISQAEEMYTTLKKQGVPAKFVRYPGEYHGGWSPWNTVHRYRQELAWWKQYLGTSLDR